jgi:hypothetical protein
MGWMGGDFTGDGKVNALDFNSLATNFGQTAGAHALGGMISAARTSPASSLFSDASAITNPLATELFSTTTVRDPLQ